MPDTWFDPISEVLKSRFSEKITHLEFVAGVRVNGIPHIGTYLTLASTFIFAAQAKQRMNLPASIHIHFLDNDPVISSFGEKPNSAYFHCVFQQRSGLEAIEFLNSHYFSYLNNLAALSGCSYTSETYSSSQSDPVFRAAVLKTLGRWKDFKYYVSGPPLIGAPTGVRGIGSPCPQCGLFDGWVRPQIDFDGDNCAILESTCCEHGDYLTSLTPFNDTFINLETTYRNVIKEILTLKRADVLTVMMKGQDWQEGLRNVNTVLEILGFMQNRMSLRFLMPVVKTESGVKLSKSAIQKFANDFIDVNPMLLDMNLFRSAVSDYGKALMNLSENILSQPQFASEPVLPSDISRLLR